ncbi:MAG: DNA polymerase I [Candidatus Sumerlaeaceae bacterium]
MSESILYVIDGHSQVFKAYHAIQRLSTSSGIPTNAVFGFTQILHKLLKTHRPQHMAVVFDSGGPTFRHEMYNAYKANRLAPPEDFGQQMGYIMQILQGMRIPILQMPGFEADDIIATICQSAARQGYDVRIVTADKDLFQLVNDQVRVLRLEPDAETEFDREGVKQKMGVYPEQVGDLLAMIGDSSDNVPGIARVGPKTACALLEEYQTLEAVLANTEKLKGKQREYVEAGRESAILSRQLVALRYDVPVEFNIADCCMEAPDVALLAPIYRELEFRKLFEDLHLETSQRQISYRIINTPEALKAYCQDIRTVGRVALDVESNMLDTILGKLVGISLSIEPNNAVYIPLMHVGAMGGGAEVQQLPLELIRQELGPLLLDPAIDKIAHNAKYDWRLLRRHGLPIDRVVFDTLLASYLINADRRNHGLKDLAADMLGVRMTRIEELIGSGKNQITFDEVDVHAAAQYAAADADMTLQLAHDLEPRTEEAGAKKLLEELELPLVPVLMDMEDCGVCIDVPHFRDLARETDAHLERLRDQIWKSVGREFNIGSPKQVAQVLFEDLQLKPVKSKKTGYSTDIQVLEELAEVHEVPRLLADYRQFEKLKSTYVDVLPTLICAATGRIHTTYNQAVAATGRLSSSDPNLQNIPIRTEFGRKIRQGFVPCDREKNVLLSADYSQIELRVLAHVTKDPALVQAYQENLDIHTLTASKVYGIAHEDVTSEMRGVAKMVNFGVIYGMSSQGLSQRLKIPFATAKTFIEEYFRGYAGVRTWLDSTLAQAKVRGYVETVSGRRRYLPDINSRNFNARNAAERMATNAPIQGTSADMIKIAMINIHRRLKQEGFRTCMIMQVHDELVFDVPKTELDRLAELVQTEMQNALPLDVPVVVETGAGVNWNEC